MHWRSFYMLWSTEEGKRQDEDNRHQNMQASKDIIAALAEVSKKSKTSKKSSKKSRCPVKSKFRTVTSKKSRCQMRLQMQHTKEEEEDTLRLIDEDRGDRTPSSSHSWMHEDVQDLDEATQSVSSFVDARRGCSTKVGNSLFGNKRNAIVSSFVDARRGCITRTALRVCDGTKGGTKGPRFLVGQKSAGPKARASPAGQKTRGLCQVRNSRCGIRNSIYFELRPFVTQRVSGCSILSNFN